MAAALQGLAALTGSPVPTVASAKTTAMNPITNFIKNGFHVGWTGLFILAGGIPFPPFSYLGFGGLNLWANGSITYGMIKGGLQGLCLLGNHYIKLFYPSLWFIGYLLVFNPWYVFDLVQMFSPAFATEGFKLPLTHKSVGSAGTTGLVSASLLAAAIALLCTGVSSLLEWLPPEIRVSYKPIVDIIFLTIAGVSALAGGGIGGMVVLPQIMAALQSDVTEIKGDVSTSVPQTGGGNLPSLADVANNILKGKGGYVQEGGGKNDMASTIFLGALAIAALGGISLALIRNKGLSYGSVE